jgi:hypothetical protein
MEVGLNRLLLWKLPEIIPPFLFSHYLSNIYKCAGYGKSCLEYL